MHGSPLEINVAHQAKPESYIWANMEFGRRAEARTYLKGSAYEEDHYSYKAWQERMASERK